jgi:outer membrane receptor protein involved in Fe transport
MLRTRVVFTALLSVAVMLSGAAQAHSQSASAAVSGVVHDASGKVVQGAAVILRNRATSMTRETVTDPEGRFHAANLAPGEYALRVTRTGFKTAVSDRVRLVVAGTTTLDVTLEAGEAAENVTQQPSAPALETGTSDVSRVVDTGEIQGLPNLGRNFVDFVKLSSGVGAGRENIGGGAFKEADTGVGPSAAPRLSFGGQSELNTMIQVDGADNVQTFTGLPRATPSQEVAQEFRLVNSTYLPEYGRALGGFVNIVTKSGGNTTAGSAYYFGMNDMLAKPSALTPPDNEYLSQHQYGATVGGPLQAGTSFFLANYEGQRRSESNQFSQLISDNLALINAVRARFNLRPETVDQIRSSDYDQAFLKFDPRFGFNHALTLKYQLVDAQAANFLGGGARGPASSAVRNASTNDQTFLFNLNSVTSARASNELRVQWARRHYGYEPLVSEPSLEIANLITMGKTTSDADSYTERRIQASDNLTIFRGRHAVKLGVDLQSLADDAQWNLFFPARIVFPSVEAFRTLTPSLFWWPSLKDDPTHGGFSTVWTSAVPAEWQSSTIFSMDHSSYGAFLQDQWQATDEVSLAFGVRYDVEHYPSHYVNHVDWNNVQPRVGLAYRLGARALLRGGYGVFTDRLANSVGQILTGSEWSSRGDLANAQALFPDIARIRGRFYQNTFRGPAAAAAALTFLTTGQVPVATGTGMADSGAGDLVNPYSQHASAQISTELGHGMVASAGYLYLRADQMIGHTGNLNAVRTGTLPSGKPIYGARQYADVGDLYVKDNLLYSRYHGATFELQERFNGTVGFHASYTLADSRNNGESNTALTDFPEDAGPDALALEWAPSRQHVRHRFTSSVMSQVPSRFPVFGGFRFNALVTLESGRRYTIFVGRDVNGDGNPNSDRPGNEPRNSLEGPGYAAVNLRIGREFALAGHTRVELTADMFNLFNRVNVRDLNTNYGGMDLSVPSDPLLGYRTPREVYNPFQMQLGARVRF